MKTNEFKYLIKSLEEESKKHAEQMLDFKFKIEDLVFQSVAVTKQQNKKFVIENLIANLDGIFDARAEQISKMKDDILLELQEILNKTNNLKIKTSAKQPQEVN